MGLDGTKTVFEVFHKARLKPIPVATGTSLKKMKYVLKMFAFSKFRYDTFQKVNNKGADQSVWMLS